MQPVDVLIDMLGTCRPMGSRVESRFREQYLMTLPDALWDDYGNIHVTIPQATGSPSQVVWSSHTDTVHSFEGYQDLAVDGRYIQLADKSQSNCLGADDTVGVWLMREMILAKVPGHYVFHWGEERGGQGSRDVTQHSPELFRDALYAIAFDRRGTKDVITHQGFGRCCSDTFARSLGKQLRRLGAGKYKPCSHGIYTDTAEYTGIINECTNLSVGYENEHRSSERTDWRHALRLLKAMLQFDEALLQCERMPGDDDDDRFDMTDWRSWKLGNPETEVVDLGPIWHRRYIKVDSLDEEQQYALAWHMGYNHPDELTDADIEHCDSATLWELGIETALRH